MEALYNKYRPQIFEDVVGQEHIERTIKNAIDSNKISHAYMFTGPRGTGKTTTARLLSKALLCEKGPTSDPDGTCEDCELVASGEHPDVYELDAASRTGVENVREEIIGKVDYAPTRGKFKVYIIDEVHMLSTAAFNALLKTLEEPPDHVIFIMCTTDPQKVPETILSRCQRFDFRRISSEELVSRLGAICEMEGINFEGDALDLIAHRAQGGMRDALTSLEQLIAFGNGEVTVEAAERMLGSLDSSDLAEIVEAIGTRDVAACFNWTSSYMETGADLVQFAGDLTQHIRDMYVMSLAGADVALDVTEAGRRELEVELSWYGPERLARMLEVLGDLLKELKTSTNQRLSFEIALTRMVRPESDLTMSALAERIEGLERSLKNGAVSQNVAPATHSQATAAPQESVSAPIGGTETGAVAPSSSEPGSAHADDFRASDVSSDTAKPAQEASTPVASQPIGSINPVQLWNTVLAHLKKIGPAYGVLFMNTNVGTDGDELVIEFSKNNDFSFKASQKQDAREALEKAFERAGHPGIRYRIVQSSAAHDSTAQTDQAIAEEPVSRDAIPPESEPEPAKVQDAEPNGTVHQGDIAPKPDASPQDTVPPWEEIDPEQSAPAEQAQETAAVQDIEAPPESDQDFQDFLTSAFGEGVVFEEVKE